MLVCQGRREFISPGNSSTTILKLHSFSTNRSISSSHRTGSEHIPLNFYCMVGKYTVIL